MSERRIVQIRHKNFEGDLRVTDIDENVQIPNNGFYTLDPDTYFINTGYPDEHGSIRIGIRLHFDGDDHIHLEYANPSYALTHDVELMTVDGEPNVPVLVLMIETNMVKIEPGLFRGKLWLSLLKEGHMEVDFGNGHSRIFRYVPGVSFVIDSMTRTVNSTTLVTIYDDLVAHISNNETAMIDANPQNGEVVLWLNTSPIDMTVANTHRLVRHTNTLPLGETHLLRGLLYKVERLENGHWVQAFNYIPGLSPPTQP